MGIKSTMYVQREEAIARIKRIAQMISDKKYRELEDNSFEPDEDIAVYVNRTKPIDISNIEDWTNDMLGGTMDLPFYRYSMFDNYIVQQGESE